jgi:GT2 family glycosyltransferase
LDLLQKSTASLPFVSLVIINYNGEKLLKTNLSNIIETDYPNFEIIVIDNASSDHSVDFLRSDYPEIKVIKLERNLGYCGAANVGAEHTKGSIIGVLNNDIRVERSWLRELVNVFLSKPDVGTAAPKKLSYTNGRVLDGAGGEINVLLAGGDRGYMEYDNLQYNFFEEVSYPPGAVYLIRREIYDKCGYLLDPDYFMYFDDPEVGARVNLLGYSNFYVPTSIVYHERGASRGPVDHKIIMLFRRNQLYYLYELYGAKIFAKIAPPFLLFNSLASIFYGLSSNDGRYIETLFIPLLQFLSHFRVVESKRRRMKVLRKHNPKAYLGKFSGELVLTVKPRPIMLNVIGVLIRLINNYSSFVKLNTPGIRTIKVIASSDDIIKYTL